MVAGFLFIPWSGGWLAWLPALLYTAADVADFFDGYAARKTNHATQLGARLDMEFDGLGMLIVSLLAVWFKQLPWWYLLIGLARYFFLAGLWLRKKRSLPNHGMPHSWHRRIFAGFQMGFMSVVLWPILPAAAATIAGTIFALATSASFLRDWLVVVGWLDPQSSQYRQRQPQIYRLFATVLPPIIRLIFAGCVVALITQSDTPWQPVGWTALFTSWHLPWPAALASFFAVAGLTAAVMITLGIMGRTMTLVVMFPIGFEMATKGANGLNGAAMAGAVLIFLLGTGAFSMWQPEERFLVRRAGE
jgi:CDP-diacylglycerol--glycerol-3-phosphate 3-phosphatidyltransferase